MNLPPHLIRKQAGLVFLLVYLLAACAGPAPTQAVQPVVPVTGQTTPTSPPTLAPAPITTAAPITPPPAEDPSPTPTAAPTARPAATQAGLDDYDYSTPPPTTAPAGCKSPAALTPPVTEGPYFKAGSPERASLLAAGISGMTLTLTGSVFNTSCQPVANALLDFWQADSLGRYDNAGFTLRGHQFTDANGRFQLVTVVPGLYPGRTEHIHVRVQAPNGPVLITQLFFPEVQNNQSDGIYTPALLINVQAVTASSMQAAFNFIIP